MRGELNAPGQGVPGIQKGDEFRFPQGLAEIIALDQIAACVHHPVQLLPGLDALLHHIHVQDEDAADHIAQQLSCGEVLLPAP